MATCLLYPLLAGVICLPLLVVSIVLLSISLRVTEWTVLVGLLLTMSILCLAGALYLLPTWLVFGCYQP